MWALLSPTLRRLWRPLSLSLTEQVPTSRERRRFPKHYTHVEYSSYCFAGSWGELVHRSLRLPHRGEGEHCDHRGQGLLHSSDSWLGRKLPQDPLRRGGGHEQLLSVRAYSLLSHRNVYRILRSRESCPMMHFEFWQRHQRQAFSLMNLIRSFDETGNQNDYGLIYVMDWVGDS